jgi:hypothetical protein
MRVAIVLLVLVLLVAAAALLPTRPYLDFQVMYHANLGLLQGIPLYDHAGQVDMIARLANVQADQVFVLPFPYPPWYALSTLGLALMPIEVAARVWFAIGLALVLASVWLLTAGERPVRRLLFFLGALLWLPVLGSLFVGQYGFPVLFGAALMIHALRGKRAVLVAVAAALLTFKPHLGGLVLMLSIINLALRRDRPGRDALLAILAAAAILFGIGFLVSPGWPAEYARSLSGFQAVDGVSHCFQCVSLPMMMARLAAGGLALAARFALIVALGCAAFLIWRWPRVSVKPDILVSAGILVTLIANPYLVNYDYMLLVIPLVVLARGIRDVWEWFALALAYIVPFLSLGLWGTAGNASLLVSMVLLSVIAARESSRTGSQPSAGTLA